MVSTEQTMAESMEDSLRGDSRAIVTEPQEEWEEPQEEWEEPQEEWEGPRGEWEEPHGEWAWPRGVGGAMRNGRGPRANSCGAGFFFLWPQPQHVEIPGPGIEPWGAASDSTGYLKSTE